MRTPLLSSAADTQDCNQESLTVNPNQSIGTQSTSNLLSSTGGRYPVSSDDIIIAVMGPTGVGKSSFINKALGQANAADTGHGLRSCTAEIQSYRCHYPDGSESNVVLVDTPGFDDTEIKDADILAGIAQWLKKSYEKGIMLTGLLYLHRISDNRMSGAPLRNLAMFKKLCGDDCFRNVLLITTMWDEVDGQEGLLRREELERKYWGSMIKRGSRMLPFHNTKASAWDVIGQLAGYKEPLLIQKEMVNQRKAFSETSAGRFVLDWLHDLIAFIQRLIENWRTSPTDQSILEAEKITAIRKLEGANEQLAKLTRYTEPDAAPELMPDPDSQSPMPSPLPDRRRASLYDQHLSRLNSRSSSTFSLVSSVQSEEGVHLYDMRLEATIMALRFATDIVDTAPIPGLKGAMSMALRVAELIVGMKTAQTELVSVVYNAGRLVLTLSEHARTGRMPDVAQRAANDLIRELKSVQKIARAVNSKNRRRVKRFFLQPAEQQLAAQCNARIQLAIAVFEIQFALDIRQVLARMEERICRLDPRGTSGC